MQNLFQLIFMYYGSSGFKVDSFLIENAYWIFNAQNCEFA